VDCFGSAAPYLSTSLWSVAINGLLYLTSTDIRSIAGHPPSNSLPAYGAYARHHPAIHEQGLRIVLGTLLHSAAQKGFGIQPLFSYFTGQTFRLMVRLLAKPNLTPETYGFLGYCHHCGTYQPVDWHHLGRSHCRVDQHPPTVSGPLWLGTLHSPDFLAAMQTRAQAQGWENAATLLQLFQAEADLPPAFYTLGDLGRRGQCDIPGRSRLIQALNDEGFAASPTHFNAQAFKTTADLPTCLAIARSLSDRA
jgi:tRNA (guanine26-N2/guanine27-N2)-dimethyltransferase